MSLVKSDSRINFGIDYYDDEDEAEMAADALAAGTTKWGQAFGRDKAFDLHDYVWVEAGQETRYPHLYAVVVP